MTVEPIVPSIFHRTKATCFAYGQTGTLFLLLTDLWLKYWQIFAAGRGSNLVTSSSQSYFFVLTGSGKTYTMQPLPLKASEDILAHMRRPPHRNEGCQLWLSFFEIYGGKLYDLLNDRRYD